MMHVTARPVIVVLVRTGPVVMVPVRVACPRHRLTPRAGLARGSLRAGDDLEVCVQEPAEQAPAAVKMYLRRRVA